VRLKKTGVIAGTVFSENGMPVTNAVVGTLQYRFINGQRKLVSVGEEVTSDDRGEVRLFDRPAGEFIVFARRSIPSRQGGSRSYVYSFYPTGTDIARAIPIEVRSGQEARVAISLSGRSLGHIHVQIVNGTSVAPSSYSVFVMPPFSNASVMAFNRTVSDADYPASEPGSYSVRVEWTTAEKARMIGMTRIEVTSDNDVSVSVRVEEPKGMLSGRVILDNIDATSLPDAKVTLSLLGALTAGRPNNPIILPGLASDGTFGPVALYPDRYEIAFNDRAPVPEGQYISAVLQSQRSGPDLLDVLSSGIDIVSGNQTRVEIHIGKANCSIHGSVTDPSGASSPDVIVALVPEGALRERFRQTENFGSQPQYRMTRTDQYGRFEIRNLISGSYQVYAVPHLDEGAYLDSEYMDTSRNMGKAIQLRDESDSTVDLRID